ncbi:MAG: sterol desaturase family protein, partial [Mycobacterium sp.]
RHGPRRSPGPGHALMATQLATPSPSTRRPSVSADDLLVSLAPGAGPVTVADAVRALELSPLAEGVAIRGRGRCRRLYLPTLLLAAGSMWLAWIGVSSLARTGGVGTGLAAGRAQLVAPMIVALTAVIAVCERIWPAERRRLLARGHLQDAAFFVLHVAVFVPFMTLLGVAFADLLRSHAAWIEAPRTSSSPRWLLLAVTLVLMDGANWLAHWAEHRFGPLWRVHALHHSQEELSVLTSFRAHPLSHIPGFFLATIPVVALAGNRGMAPLLITAYVCLGTLPHANVRWSFGPLGRVVVSPAYHRLHHSAGGPDGLNLGIVLTVWDMLAGRARFPVDGASACRTGLADRSVRIEQEADGRWHPGVLLSQLTEPFLDPVDEGLPAG